MLTPDTDRLDSPPLALNLRGTSAAKGSSQGSNLRTLRVGRKDYKKAGDGLRGKNVTEAFRVKEKDMKRTMKWVSPGIPVCLRRQGSQEPNREESRRKKHNQHRSEPSCLRRQVSDVSIIEREEELELMDRRIKIKSNSKD